MNVPAFLAELEALTRKHKVVIDGCHCCGSPYLTELKEPDFDHRYVVRKSNDYLEWNKVEDDFPRSCP